MGCTEHSSLSSFSLCGEHSSTLRCQQRARKTHCEVTLPPAGQPRQCVYMGSAAYADNIELTVCYILFSSFPLLLAFDVGGLGFEFLRVRRRLEACSLE